ncbi:MAG TPA: aldose epimerase family protein [Bryobacteraceae bacterium]|jgi:aldose 1-epimerase|nr:aldose epimerase family protein [Bryobacteraceae bacterium]
MIDIEHERWGELSSGKPIELYRLRNGNGLEAQITNYGGRLVSLKTPDRAGKLGDLVLGFDNLAGYLAKNPYFGALVGRYANRIAHGEFSLNGTRYRLARNNGENALHGGIIGFDKVRWDASEIEDGLELRYLSRDGEEGYPGNLQVRARYRLSSRNELAIEYEAETDRDTVLNLTNHSYFDLSGEGAGSIVDHEVTIHADRFTPVNAHLIPTGELKPVEGTPFDFRKPTRIGARIDEKDEQLAYAIGYDHNYVLDGNGTLTPAARAVDHGSGRVLEVATTQPGMQFYTGNHLDGSVVGKHGRPYVFRSGFCFETQHFPDSPNQPNFPSTVLRPGEKFRSVTVFRFSTV